MTDVRPSTEIRLTPQQAAPVITALTIPARIPRNPNGRSVTHIIPKWKDL